MKYKLLLILITYFAFSIVFGQPSDSVHVIGKIDFYPKTLAKSNLAALQLETFTGCEFKIEQYTCIDGNLLILT